MADELTGGPPVHYRSVSGRLSRRRRRVLAGVAGVAALAGGLVAAGLTRTAAPGRTAAAHRTATVVGGRVAALTSGRHQVFALVDPCPGRAEGCTPILVSSPDEGVHWARRPLPAGHPPMTRRSPWTLLVLPDERPALEIGTTLYVGTADGTGYTSRPEHPGPAVGRVPVTPDGRPDPAARLPDGLVRLCPAPACGRPVLRYLDAATGQLRPLTRQPPLVPAAVAVGGPWLWVAGLEPRSRAYAAALSPDGGRTWQRIALPGASTDPDLSPILRPDPRGDRAYLLFAYPPLELGQRPIYDVWTLASPDPGLGRGPGAVPRRVWPEENMSAIDAIALDNGLLLCSDSGRSATLAPNGVVRSQLGRDPVTIGSLRYGGDGHVIGAVIDDTATIVVSESGAPDDWQTRPITLP